MLLSACGDEPQSTPTPDAVLARVPESTGVRTPQPTSTTAPAHPPVPTSTRAPTATPTDTPTSQPTPTATATRTPVPTPTHAPTATPTNTATPQPTPIATAAHTPVPTPTQAPTATPTNTATPQSTPTAAPTHIPVPTPTQAPTATPTNTPAPTPVPTVQLALDADATVAGYWSDGTADVEIAMTLRNEGDLRLDHAVRLAVTCGPDCGQEMSVSLPDGYGPVTEMLTIRSPAGEASFEIDYGGENVQTLSVDVPKRIVGVNRDVWECFSDTSKVNTVWEEYQGVGCAAWSHEVVRKWDQGSPVKVWLNGSDSFTVEFKDVLAELSPVLNLRFEWVEARSDADVSAHVGLTIPEAEAEGVYCDSIDAFGCANTSTDSWSGEAVGGEIIVYNLWPDKGVDFGDFDDWYRSRFRSAMIHEAVHVFSDMRHRTELLSIMNSEVHHRAELTPMDGACAAAAWARAGEAGDDDGRDRAPDRVQR